MDSGKTNIQYFEGGYFIYHDEDRQSDYLSQPELSVTLPEFREIKNELISLIKNAKQSIKLCSFILSDPEVYSELMDVTKSKKVALFIITQLDNSKFSTSFLSDEEATENYYQKHLDYISKLYMNGAHVRAATSAHAKFLIVDDKHAFLMSANITTPSLNENPESGVYIKEEDSKKSLIKLFDLIYQYGTEYTKFKVASKDKQFVVSRDVQLKEDWLIGVDKFNIKFTWGTDNMSLYSEMIKLIEEANTNEKIIISSYSVVGLENLPEFTNSIKNYIEKGGEVILFCRGMNYRPDHLQNCTLLSNLGVKIYGDFFNHSKGIICGNKGFIFTANIDGHHGLLNGFEVGMKINGIQSTSLKNFISWQIKNSPYKFKLNPSKQDLYDTYDYYTKIKNINAPEFTQDITFEIPKSLETLSKDLIKIPIYIYLSKLKVVEGISLNNSYYSAKIVENKIVIGKRRKKFVGSETYLLKCQNPIVNVKKIPDNE